MVGAIADWFAVTALFKHPLGLPIPHTALIPRRKDELGRGLEEFVGENFLQEEHHPRPGRGRRRSRCGSAQWLAGAGATPAGSSTRSPTSPRSGWPRSRDEHIADLVTRGAGARASSRSRSRRCWAACSRRWSATTCTTGWSTWRSRSCTAGWCTTRTPSPRCSASGRPGGRRRGSTTRSPHRLHLEAVRWVADIRDDPRHHARAGARLDAGPARPGPAARPGHPGARRAAQGAAARATRRWSTRRSRCGTPCAARCSASLAGPRGRRAPRGCWPSWPPSPTGCSPTRPLRARLDRTRRGRRGLRGRRGTAPSSPP